MAADAEVSAACVPPVIVYDILLAVYEIAVSTFNTSPLANCLLVSPPASVPDFSYFTNIVRSLEESAACVPTTFATTFEVAPVSFFPTKSVLKFSAVCVVEPEIKVA